MNKKVKKLLRNPKLFFKDMYAKKKSEVQIFIPKQ